MRSKKDLVNNIGENILSNQLASMCVIKKTTRESFSLYVTKDERKKADKKLLKILYHSNTMTT